MSNENYHVYGIGNALVDFEVEVSVEEIVQLGIEKGVMTLINEDRHQSLQAHLHGTRHNRACGGSAANTIIAISQLGGKTFYSCRVGNDETGDFYLKDLQSNGVVINHESHRPDDVTGKCIVLVTPDADRTMNTYLGVTGELGVDSLVPSAMKSSQYVYIEGYLVSSPTALEAACSARAIAEENDLSIAISLSDPSMVSFFREGLIRLIGKGVDLLFCNESEALEYTNSDNLGSAITELKKIAKRFVITLGAAGSTIWDGANLIDVEGHNVKAIDTTGAGDMYAGAFLYGLTHGFSHQKAGKLASFASAQVVQKFGPRLQDDQISIVRQYLDEINS